MSTLPLKKEAVEALKKYPNLRHMIYKTTAKRLGFSISDVRAYRKALRELAMSSPDYKKRICFVELEAKLICCFTFSYTKEGFTFWDKLSKALKKADKKEQKAKERELTKRKKK